MKNQETNIERVWNNLSFGKKIVKELKKNGNAGAFIEFSKDELDMLGLKSGDMVEWMQLDDGTVWKKVIKNEWSL